MLCHRLTPSRSISLLSLLILIFFLILSSSLTLAHRNYHGGDGTGEAEPETEAEVTTIITSWENNINDGVYTNTTRRSVAEDSNKFILAANHTLRNDPLNKWRLYRGGWDVTNKHYWASLGYSGAVFLVIAVVWFVVFGITLLISCICFCCCKRKPKGYSRFCYGLSLAFLIFFTIAAILGCIFLYKGQGEFYRSTTQTVKYVVSRAHYVLGNVNNITHSLFETKNIGVEDKTLPEEWVKAIGDLQKNVDDFMKVVKQKLDEVSKDITKKYLHYVSLFLIVLSAVMLFLAFVGFVLSIFGLECLVYTLVVFGWILVTATFILCGVCLVIHNVVTDTCVAMQEWEGHRGGDTALDEFLPCLDKSITQEILMVTNGVTHGLVGIVNFGIDGVANDQSVFNYNQSGPLVPRVCDPFNDDLSNRTCTEGEVDLGHASEALKKYECEVKEEDGNKMCVTTGRLTPKLYSQMNSAVNMSNSVYHYVGDMVVEIEDCNFVRRTFRDITRNNCPGLMMYTRWIYSGLFVVATSVMFSLIIWVFYARERRHRVYTKQFNYSVTK